VLVVDDHPDVRFLLRAVVEFSGYNAVEADNGDEALALVERVRPDLVLLDLQIPGASGLEVCRRLRAAEATRWLPILMVSAVAEPEIRAEALEAGVDEYLTKPFRLVELIAHLHRWLGAG
jgi:two-component system phosphate regulon response regulator PhoB